MSGLAPGISHTIAIEVTPELLAPRFVEGTPSVYGSPAMIALIEQTAKEAVEGCLGPGETTVGVSFDLRHLAATPPGMKVRCSVVLTEVDRARLKFDAEVHDEVEKIGEGVHQRFIVNREKFQGRVDGKGRG